MFDENSTLDENEQAQMMEDLHRAEAHNEVLPEVASKDKAKSLRNLLKENGLPDSIKEEIQRDVKQHNFYKILNHIIKHKRINLEILKRQDRVNLNDVIKFMFAWIAYETAKDDICFDYTYTEFFDAESIADEINYWERFECAWLDEVLMAAFAKHRGDTIKHNMKEFAKFLSTNQIVFPQICNLYVNLDNTGISTLVNNLMCAFKFDNRDRDYTKNIKLMGKRFMKDFDFDERRNKWVAVSKSSKFEFFTWFATLQTTVYLADNGCAEHQTNLNTLVKTGFTHMSEIDTIRKLLQVDISDMITD